MAIKVIDKTRFSDQEEKIHREVDILHEITHPGVIKLHAMFDTPGKVKHCNRQETFHLFNDSVSYLSSFW